MRWSQREAKLDSRVVAGRGQKRDQYRAENSFDREQRSFEVFLWFA
jgi:hypothetical protein